MKMTKKKPNGFVAKCQCGEYVGALDFNQTEQIESGKIMGAWLTEGCTVEPRFSGSWSVNISSCKCEE